MFEPAPGSGTLPPLALLDEPKEKRKAVSDESLEAISRQVELKLADFGIEAEVVAVHPGPVVTRYELQPAPGLKVSRVTNLAKDLARSLSTVSVRIVEVIPGKTTIGLEIPNEEREIVVLSDVLKSSQYDADASHLALGLGKDISGQPVVVDLASMPHLLVAGTTGSGKSVAINAMILSLLYKASSSDVRMIMIDPKMLELSVYEGIPHLLAPVVTDMKHASNALRWCVVEMDRRYRLMSALGVRNIGGYNRKVSAAADGGAPHPGSAVPAGRRRRRGAGAREAPVHRGRRRRARRHDDADRQEGRRADRAARAEGARGGHPPHPRDPATVGRRDHRAHQGEHPQPHRVPGVVEGGFQDHSRPDGGGAPARARRHALPRPGVSAPSRVHGAFVADHEVHKVVKNLKQAGKPCLPGRDSRRHGHRDAAPEGAAGSAFEAGGESGAEADPLYDQAVRIVTETRRASISGVQRRLKIGYNRAARMLEEMEHAGVVGPLQSNGSREVLAPPPPAD